MKKKLIKVARVLGIVMISAIIITGIIVGITVGVTAGIKAICSPCWPCGGAGGQVTPTPTPDNGAQLPTKAEMNNFLRGAWYPGICSSDLEHRVKLAFPNSQPTWETKDGALLLYVTVREGKFQVAWHQEGDRQIGSLVP